MLTLAFKSTEVGINLPIGKTKIKTVLAPRAIGTIISRSYEIDPLPVKYADGVEQTITTLSSLNEYKVGEEVDVTQRTKNGKFYLQLG